MIYRIVHETHYASADPISVGHNEAWLTPRSTPSQNILSHKILIIPDPSLLTTRVDYFGNTVSQFVFNQGYLTMSVTAMSDIEVFEPPHQVTTSPAWEKVIESLRSHATASDLEAFEYTFESARCRISPEFAAYCAPHFTPGRPIVEALRELMGKFYQDFANDPHATTVSTPVEQVFRQRRGVCQDFSHMLISMLRSLGLSARYISGYLRTLPPPGKARLVGADASHAWISVYCGKMGWVDMDPTNNQFPSTDHVTIGWGRDYVDVAPVKGVYIGGSTPRLHVSVDVAIVD